MPVIYFAGQDNFGNRGCEALVRSLVKTFRAFDASSKFLVPSRDRARDQAQWTDSEQFGVEFVEAEPIPAAIRWWSRGRRLFGGLDARPPSYKVSDATARAISRSDVLVMTGGDIISLDYGLESLYYWSRICEFAMEQGIPTALLGASIGPFSTHPATERRMVAFLKRFSLITVRETASLAYLESIGISGAHLVTDPAFALEPEDARSECPDCFVSPRKMLGFNVSPLIRKFREDVESKLALDREVVKFLATIVANDPELSIVLVPHVDPLSGAAENSDSVYMAGLLSQLKQLGVGVERIIVVPSTLNAAQLKDVIGLCDYFIGARTHATIAALSREVPTISIAYSVKAKGINHDLFGHTRYVLDTSAVTAETLGFHFSRLVEEAPDIRVQLSQVMPGRKIDATRSAEFLSMLLNDSKQQGTRA